MTDAGPRPRMTGPRRWARRAVLSALAGSGLTAAGLGGPLVGGALGAEAAGGPSPAGDNPAPPVQGTGQQGADGQGTGQSQAAGQPATTTSTIPTPSSTSSGPSAAPPPAEGAGQAGPTVVVQRKQKATAGEGADPTLVNTRSKRGGGQGGNAKAQGKPATNGGGSSPNGPTTTPPGTLNGVAPAPQAIGGEAGELPSLLAGSAVSAQALSFYRIPLFLLPIYQAAAIQYDVPWQILAAINEVETDYGTDLSVSTAGAVGWMQFMPQTWLGYGVDATDAGYADPYNPVDAIFAAARYLHAAGASHHLSAAILAYNHSQAYVESVLLRARLISSYPSSAIATLTGLVDGRPPTAHARVVGGGLPISAGSGVGLGQADLGTAAASTAAAPSTVAPTPSSAASSATAGAMPAAPPPSAAAHTAAPATAGVAHAAAATGAVGHSAATPTFKPPPPPWVVAQRAEAAADLPAKPSQLVDLIGTVGAPVVAVQDGRVVHLGHSHSLGRYLVLRDIYGDVFTYAGLGSIAPRYRVPEPRPPKAPETTPGSGRNVSSPVQGAPGVGEPARDPTPAQPASAGHQPPLTLKVRTHVAPAAAPAAATLPVEAESEAETAPPGMGRARLFAHPGNPLARAAAARAARSSATGDSRWRPLRIGAIVSQGTVLGRLDTPRGDRAGHLRFAIRPSGDSATVDPEPILANWRQLDAALHPRGSSGRAGLVGATAAAVFTMSKSELERAALSDAGIELSSCGRREIASGAVDRRVLAVLEFLSRSGLQPTVSGLRCHGAGASDLHSSHHTENAVDISAINGIPIAGHQGPGTIADTTIRTLLTLRGRFAPHRIVSLMRYPEASSTLALPDAWNHIRIGFSPAGPSTAPLGSAHAARAASAPLAVTGELSPAEWERLIARIAALPQPTIAAKPTSAAIRDPLVAPNRGLGAGG
jgi:Transglycosylase SLT domain